MNQDKKGIIQAACLVAYAVIMTSLVYFLKHMGLDYVLGFGSGAALMIGCIALISRDFRNMH